MIEKLDPDYTKLHQLIFSPLYVLLRSKYIIQLSYILYRIETTYELVSLGPCDNWSLCHISEVLRVEHCFCYRF